MLSIYDYGNHKEIKQRLNFVELCKILREELSFKYIYNWKLYWISSGMGMIEKILQYLIAQYHLKCNSLLLLTL